MFSKRDFDPTEFLLLKLMSSFIVGWVVFEGEMKKGYLHGIDAEQKTLFFYLSFDLSHV